MVKIRCQALNELCWDSLSANIKNLMEQAWHPSRVM
jgi:hypothetical protein